MQATKKPTPTEWQVIAWLFIIGPALFGVFLFWAANRVLPEKPDVAREAFRLGYYCFGGSALALLLWKGIKRFL